ncbi:MAG: DEAD/DEAH box helicase [Putridiphycobacter sp.]|nr:DEAD/DEAH box helicase [Putridiphycobacter sp.]
MNGFTALGVHPHIAKRLTELGIEQPTPIQEQTLPYLLEKGGDFIGMAQTGTGKTAAYGLPLLQRCNHKQRQVQCLVLAPTRELVQQIAKMLFKFTKYYQPIYTVGVYGGPSLDKQIAALKKPTQIVVATPGRLIDLIERKQIDLSFLKYLVLDEADEMLKLGFKDDLDYILTAANTRIQKWLFSATMPRDIEALVKKHLYHQAKKVIISQKSVLNTDIKHEYIPCKTNEKLNVLIQFLNKQKDKRAIIFCKTKKATELLNKQLIAKGFPSQAIQGDMTQIDRDKVMRAFKNKTLRLLISTDVSARGIDVDNLAFVLHYEMPDQIDYYTHRAGRTARGGRKGASIALVDEKELRFLKNLSKSLNFELNETVI